MNKLPPAIYPCILWMIIVVCMVFVFSPVMCAITNGEFWPIPLLIVVVCFIIYRFRRKKLSNNKPKEEQKQ